MENERVLIIEDDPTLLRGLSDNFRFKGFEVETAVDGRQGLEAALLHAPDLIILDVMLPEVNGYEICKRVREAEITTPIIMLTARGREEDVVRGLNAGAHDYMTKPFSIKELLARAQNLLKREHESHDQVVHFGDCELDLVSHKLFREGTEIALTPKEFGVLIFFVKHQGRAMTRDEIMSSVWGSDIMVTPRSVDRCINTLRHKVEPDPPRPVFIQTVRDIGYRFEIPEGVQPKPALKATPNACHGLDTIDQWKVGLKVGGFHLMSTGEERRVGRLFEARDMARDRVVRLLALPNLYNKEAIAALDKDCETASTLSHPGLHTYARVDMVEGVNCLSWVKRDGLVLRDKLGGGALDAGRSLGVGRAVLEVLLEAHEVGLLNLDLAPDRILIVPEAVVVGGFGLARAVRIQAMAEGNPIFGPLSMLGASYQSPEQIRGQIGDARSDIFLFGCLMHEMLAGIHPFKGETAADTMAAILTGPPPKLPEGRAPKQLARIIDHCLEKKPEERFQTCRDLHFALGGLE